MTTAKSRILIAPLNWGWGHASRVIPLVRRFLEEGNEVLLAGNGSSFRYIRNVFPDLKAIELPGVELRYSNGKSQTFAILKALPGIIEASVREHKAVSKIVQENNIDLIISDNRFGLFCKDCRSVYITHQRHIALPHPFQWMEPLADAIHRKIIRQYDECWIPDNPTIQLSGLLGNKRPLASNERYIGLLSQLTPSEAEIQYDVLFLLSGIEPQRILFEAEAWRFCRENTNVRTIIVRGTYEKSVNEGNPNTTVVDVAQGEELSRLIAQSRTVVMRSGYSSLMDLYPFGKQCVLVPTPGQPEQEYLAQYLCGRYPERFITSLDI